MLYAIVFAVLAAYLVALAVYLGDWALLLLWPALGLLLFAAAYAGAGPRLLGKRPDGRLRWWAWLLLGPVLLFVWTVWHLQRLLSREPASHEVAPGVWLGRRALARELPPGVVLVIDLTAEFPVARGVAHGREYVALPTLDGTAPQEEALRAALTCIVGSPGPVYIHCAMGHGRSATLAAAVLLARGLAGDVAQAEKMLRGVRPGVRLKPAQRELLRRLFVRTS
jgi:protein-tyrosine phosphatase